jgi:hypothetical protein
MSTCRIATSLVCVTVGTLFCTVTSNYIATKMVTYRVEVMRVHDLILLYKVKVKVTLEQATKAQR